MLVPALLAIPAWAGIQRSISTPEAPPELASLRFNKKQIIIFIALIAVVGWLTTTSSIIHTFLIAEGDENMLYMLLGLILPPVAFLLYGFISDKGYERIAFVFGMFLFIIGILLAMLSGDAGTPLLLPLTVADGLGGTFAEFFILAAPIVFLVNTKRPVFAMALGVVLNLFSSAFMFEMTAWAPDAFQDYSAPLLIFSAILALAFITLAWVLFDRRSETTLAAALYGFMQSQDAGETVMEPGLYSVPPYSALEAEPPYIPEIMEARGFLPEEREVASLLIEGFTKGEIAHRLHIPTADVSERMRSIREKIGGYHTGADQLLENVAAEYKLTARESQILRGLYEGKTNVKIAEELFVSPDTVKFHARNLMKKLSLEGRAELREWLISRSAD
jgi:DNA-binding NarL/FixJ family response regulator